MGLAAKRSARPHARGPARGRSAGPASYLAIVLFVGAVFTVNAFWSVPLWTGGVYLLASVVCFAAYAVDKRAAGTGRWRISERTLLVLGFLGGWPGAIIAQQTLRHKTRKASFRRAFWGTVGANVLVFALIFMLVATPTLSRFAL